MACSCVSGSFFPGKHVVSNKWTTSHHRFFCILVGSQYVGTGEVDNMKVRFSMAKGRSSGFAAVDY